MFLLEDNQGRAILWSSVLLTVHGVFLFAFKKRRKYFQSGKVYEVISADEHSVHGEPDRWPPPNTGITAGESTRPLWHWPHKTFTRTPSIRCRLERSGVRPWGEAPPAHRGSRRSCLSPRESRFITDGGRQTWCCEPGRLLHGFLKWTRQMDSQAVTWLLIRSFTEYFWLEKRIKNEDDVWYSNIWRQFLIRWVTSDCNALCYGPSNKC